MGKVLFFDIDGTLIPFDKPIPDSTVSALDKARENGHRLVICSGRSRHQLQEELGRIEFDGYILESGAYIENQGQIIYQNIIENEELDFLISELEMTGAIYSAQTATCGVTTNRCMDRLVQFYINEGAPPEAVRKLKADRITMDSLRHRHDVEKVVYHEASITVSELRQRIGHRFELTELSFSRIDPFSGEITAKGIHKASGMERYLHYHGLSREDSIAFGDGPNDFEMIEYAGIGVVMGNGIDDLKEKADYITSHIEEDGIKNALEHFDLI